MLKKIYQQKTSEIHIFNVTPFYGSLVVKFPDINTLPVILKYESLFLILSPYNNYNTIITKLHNGQDNIEEVFLLLSEEINFTVYYLYPKQKHFLNIILTTIENTINIIFICILSNKFNCRLENLHHIPNNTGIESFYKEKNNISKN